MRATLIVNPAAGSADAEEPATLADRLRAIYDLDVVELGDGLDAGALARAAVAGGAEVVIAAGGDGTVSAVADALVGTDAALGIVPRGTANSLAVALGIPAELDGACALLARDERRVIDTARCGDRFMVLHCSIGLHAETIGETSRDAKKRWGTLAYLAKAASKLVDVEPFEVELETEGHVIRTRAVSIAVANLAPPQTVVAQGPSLIAGDDGLLDVTVLAPTSLAEAVAMGLHLLRSANRQEPATRDDIGYFACQRLRITATPPQQVAVDGELIGTTPVEIVSRPQSLQVVAPPPAQVRAAPEAKLDALPAVEIERKPPVAG